MTAGEEVHALLERHGLKAKKSWGQNFLVDENAYRRIVDAACPRGGERVLEIGAGLGTLTRRLAARAGRVWAVEREADMLAVLRTEFAGAANVEIVAANALTLDLGAIAGAEPLVVVGNLPYQIASQILFRVLEARAHVSRLVVMLQKEMAARILSPPGSRDYGVLSVLMQIHGTVERVCRVGAGGFLPPPRVDSTVLRLTPLPDHKFAAPLSDLAWFSRVVHAAFAQRRKTLRNSLQTLVAREVAEAGLAAASIDPQRRAETLSLAELARLAEELHARAA